MSRGPFWDKFLQKTDEKVRMRKMKCRQQGAGPASASLPNRVIAGRYGRDYVTGGRGSMLS